MADTQHHKFALPGENLQKAAPPTVNAAQVRNGDIKVTAFDEGLPTQDYPNFDEPADNRDK
jgi:hypothetical protein